MTKGISGYRGNPSTRVAVAACKQGLNKAWEQYCACCDKYADLLDDSCEKEF